MEDVQRVMDKLGKANRLMENLIDLAMDDESLSDDEQGLLTSINQNLGQYAQIIIGTIKDGKVEFSELDELKEMEAKIISDAQSIANRDDKVSEEEKTLLNQLIETIENM